MFKNNKIISNFVLWRDSCELSLSKLIRGKECLILKTFTYFIPRWESRKQFDLWCFLKHKYMMGWLWWHIAVCKKLPWLLNKALCIWCGKNLCRWGSPWSVKVTQLFDGEVESIICSLWYQLMHEKILYSNSHNYHLII